MKNTVWQNTMNEGFLVDQERNWKKKVTKAIELKDYKKLQFLKTEKKELDRRRSELDNFRKVWIAEQDQIHLEKANFSIDSVLQTIRSYPDGIIVRDLAQLYHRSPSGYLNDLLSTLEAQKDIEIIKSEKKGGRRPSSTVRPLSL